MKGPYKFTLGNWNQKKTEWVNNDAKNNHPFMWEIIYPNISNKL